MFLTVPQVELYPMLLTVPRVNLDLTLTIHSSLKLCVFCVPELDPVLLTSHCSSSRVELNLTPDPDPTLSTQTVSFVFPSWTPGSSLLSVPRVELDPCSSLLTVHLVSRAGPDPDNLGWTLDLILTSSNSSWTPGSSLLTVPRLKLNLCSSLFTIP